LVPPCPSQTEIGLGGVATTAFVTIKSNGYSASQKLPEIVLKIFM